MQDCSHGKLMSPEGWCPHRSGSKACQAHRALWVATCRFAAPCVRPKHPQDRRPSSLAHSWIQVSPSYCDIFNSSATLYQVSFQMTRYLNLSKEQTESAHQLVILFIPSVNLSVLNFGFCKLYTAHEEVSLYLPSLWINSDNNNT